MARVNDLGKDPVPSLLLRLALPGSGGPAGQRPV